VLDSPQPIRRGVKPLLSLGENDVIAFPHAVGHALGASQLLTPIVRAPATAYSYNPTDQSEALDPEELFGAGSQLGLVSALQARNSARVVVLGSAEALQDKWFGAKVAKLGGNKVIAANREFAKKLSAWAFQETGVLRVNSVSHHLKGGNETAPELYIIKQEVVSRDSLRCSLYCAYSLT
jgi:oligosaccharyltransferase complex subunit beta